VIPVSLLLADGRTTDSILGYVIEEATEPDREDRINRTVQRLAVARQRLIGDAMRAATEHRLCTCHGSVEVRDIAPRGEAFRSRLRTKSPATWKAEADFMRQVDVIEPSDNTDNRWALKHKPTNVVVYFKMPRPLALMSDDERTAVVEEAIDALVDAIDEKEARDNGTVALPN
jgi:hypothetical protein